MSKQELLGEVKKLITIGKEKGFLTYDELNSTLPAEVVASDQFGSIMAMFGEMDIEIIEASVKLAKRWRRLSRRPRRKMRRRST